MKSAVPFPPRLLWSRCDKPTSGHTFVVGVTSSQQPVTLSGVSQTRSPHSWDFHNPTWLRPASMKPVRAESYRRDLSLNALLTMILIKDKRTEKTQRDRSIRRVSIASKSNSRKLSTSIGRHDYDMFDGTSSDRKPPTRSIV